MAVEFSALNIEANEYVIPFQWGEETIGVKKYLSVEEKDNIIQLTLANSQNKNGLYNPMLLEVYFHVFLVFKYTDIEFSDEDLEDAGILYDKIESSGFLKAFLSVMDDEEYNNLFDMVQTAKEESMQYGNTFNAMLQGFLNDLPNKMKEVAEIAKQFDPEQFKAVMDFARAANGGREIE